jgi:outer membrane protein TolC
VRVWGALVTGTLPLLIGVAWAAAPPPEVESTALEVVGFEEAVKLAISRNPQTSIAAAEVERARGLVEQVRAAWLPTLYGTATYTRLDADRKSGSVVIAREDQLNLNLLLTVPLIAPARWLASAHAADNREVAKLSAREVRRQIAVLAARAYLTVLTEHRLVDSAGRARDTALAHRDFAHARFTSGVGNRLDEVRAAQEYEADAAQLETAWATLRRAQEALGVVLGSDHPIDAAEEPRLEAPPTLGEALDSAADRPDLKTAHRQKRAADRVVRDRYADYLPYLTANFQPLYQNPPTLTLPAGGYQAQLILTVPLFDGGLRYGLDRERQAIREEARAQVESLLRQARAEVRSSFVTLERVDRSLDAARRSAVLTREALSLATLAYRAGTANNLDVIDAERRARDADTQVALAEDAARQARIDLLTASGRFP